MIIEVAVTKKAQKKSEAPTVRCSTDYDYDDDDDDDDYDYGYDYDYY